MTLGEYANARLEIILEDPDDRDEQLAALRREFITI